MLRNSYWVCSTTLFLASSLGYAGVYTGLGLGPDTIEFKQRSNVVYYDAANPTQGFNVIDKTHLSARGVFGTIFGGYEYLNNQFYLAGEINGNLSSAVFKSSNIERIHGSYSSTAYKIKNSVGISLLPGYQFSPATLFYGRLGLTNGHVKVITSDQSLENLSTNKGGFRWGLGARQAVSDHFSVRMEYSQINYKGANMATYDNLSNVSKRTRISPSQQLVEFGLVYSFADGAVKENTK